jgi:cysteine-rich repeat protein
VVESERACVTFLTMLLRGAIWCRPAGSRLRQVNLVATLWLSACIGPADLGPFPRPTDGCPTPLRELVLEGYAAPQCLSCAAATSIDPTTYCDDGNTNESDSCPSTCIQARCGDGFTFAGVEECDDGNEDTSDGCVSCKNATCGDGFQRVGVEECDDGNDSSTDGCVSCQIATCGDGFQRVGVEECDDGNDDFTDDCVNCNEAVCGDGFERAGLEECDDGNGDNTDGCVSGCQKATCGDGFTWSGAEECDDGNGDDTDSCVSGCKIATCGDGFTRMGVEECEDLNEDNTDGCVNCLFAKCGDGFQHAGVEQCDDNNVVGTDACTASCSKATCGDSLVWMGEEQCDDGNSVKHDGCEPNCLTLDVDWAQWPAPNSSNSGLPHPQSYEVDPQHPIVTDLVTGLRWQQVVENIGRTWPDADAYCRNLVIGPYTDWRLPTRIELLSIVDYSKAFPALNPVFQLPANASQLWTSTVFAGNALQHWTVVPSAGYVGRVLDTSPLLVRCVR